MLASQKLLNIARGAIAIVINSRIFGGKKKFDSKHIPENKTNKQQQPQTNSNPPKKPNNKTKQKSTWKIHDLMFLINTLGVQFMLRALLRVWFPFSHLTVLMACEVEELGSHLSACLDCSSAFGGIAELCPFLPLSTAAGPAAGSCPAEESLQAGST